MLKSNPENDRNFIIPQQMLGLINVSQSFSINDNIAKKVNFCKQWMN